MLLSRNLKTLLEDKELTLTQLAKLSGVPKSTLSGWVHGSSTNPRIDQLILVADALRVSIDFLITGRKPEEPDLENLLNKIELFNGQFELSIKRITKK